jgi:hypothetical protein
MRLPTLDRNMWRGLSKSKYRWAYLALMGLVLVGLIFAFSTATRRDAKPVNLPASEVSSTSLSEGGSFTPQGLSADADWRSAIWAILALILVLGCVYGSLWAVRFVTQRGRLGRVGAPLVQVQSSTRLNGNQMLHVVKFGPQILLIGSSSAGLSVLGTMTGSDVGVPPRVFATVLEETLGEEILERP